MNKRKYVLVVIGLLLGIITSGILGYSYSRNNTIYLTGESTVYNMSLCSREIYQGLYDESADVSYHLTYAALLLQKAHSQLDSSLSFSFGIDSRKSFAGNMEDLSILILYGGSYGESYIRPASQVKDDMTQAEVSFYQGLIKIIDSIVYQHLSIEDDPYSVSFTSMGIYDLRNIAYDFQVKTAALLQ